MGDAKRRRDSEQRGDAGQEKWLAAVSAVSSALKRLATAASEHLGGDCYLHAVLGQQLLADLGFETKVQVGFAAWRIGPGDGDVISHTLQEKSYLPPGTTGFPYHAWLRGRDCVVDFTTYQLEQKAKELDALDGGKTTVTWCPPYLLLPLRRVRLYRQVAQAMDAGHAHYEPHPELLARLSGKFSLDADDLATARLLLANPSMAAVGPNHIAR